MLFILFPFCLQAQTAWTWEELPSMPAPISNNAVCEAVVNDTAFVYSFCGIDTTKQYSGINLNAYRYNTVTEEWITLPNVPDTLGKIAASANHVNGLIYIIGGYHVISNSSEITSDKVHIFDPATNTYLPDGTEIPVPIDDQVQAVWKDSLIYVVTGWSNNGNVNAVQIYNPYLNTWSAGTATPNNNLYRAFGATGIFVDDTLYYNGGATGSSFNSTGRLRKGYVDPNNPTDITWEVFDDNPGAEGYRMASVSVDDKAFWIGGSGVTYNFNGIAYNGSGGVSPLNRILRYNSSESTWFEGLGAPYGIMDLRGAARISETEFVICGGMMGDQQVTDRAFKLTFDINNSFDEVGSSAILAYPSPFREQIIIQGLPRNTGFSIIDLSGRSIFQDVHSEGAMIIDTSKWSAGNYFLKLEGEKSKDSIPLIKL
ncbi:MAG: T9SS type A sorting domain-containing protein [Flavobacteriales bacterium]|nr:T9SS type A sorting domain-containing protein [Flavobacteriales bacterium]